MVINMNMNSIIMKMKMRIRGKFTVFGQSKKSITREGIFRICFGFGGKPDGLKDRKQEIGAWKVLKLLVHKRGICGDFLEEDLMNPELEVQSGVLQKDASSQFGRFPGRALKSVGLPGKEQGGHLQPAPLVGICIWGGNATKP